MTRPAAQAVLTLALSLGVVSQALAQGTSTSTDSSTSTQGGVHTGFSANQTSSTTDAGPGKVPASWSTNPSTGIGTYGHNHPTVTSTTRTTPVPAASTSTSTSTGTESAPAPQTTILNGKKMIIPPPPPGKGGPSAAAGTPAKKSSETFTLQESPPNVAKTAGMQRFDNWINLKTGQDQLQPLNLIINNNGFSTLKISLSGRQIATEKNFKDNTLALSLAGAVGVGQNQLIIQGYAQPGAKVTWRITALKPTATAADPKEVAPGDTFTITGKHFSLSPSLDEVWIGKKEAAVKNVTSKTIEATVPKDAESGDQKLIVRIAGMETKPLSIKVKAPPQLISIDMYQAPPGYVVTITGKGFADKLTDNSVTVAGVNATVVSASATSLSFQMPDLGGYTSGPQVVKVKSSGVEAKEGCTVNAWQNARPWDGTGNGVTPAQ